MQLLITFRVAVAARIAGRVPRSERSERRRHPFVDRRLGPPAYSTYLHPREHTTIDMSSTHVLYSRTTHRLEAPVVRTVKLRKMGGSIGATLPKDLAERLHLDVGDEVFVVATDEGLLITPYDPTFDKAMAVYRRGAKKYQNALRELAK